MNSKTHITNEEYDLLCKILKHLIDSPISEAFREPVDYITYGLIEYPKIVKRPMDLGTVKKNLNSFKYMTVKKVLDDI